MFRPRAHNENPMRQPYNLLEIGADDDNRHAGSRERCNRFIDGGTRTHVIPRVGSSRMNTFGEREIQRAITTFC